jgi:D-cysteine desulfhydrase
VLDMPDRERIASLPTPLETYDRLSASWGGPRIWVKRDDRTGFGLSGNKVRKLEFHVFAARAAGADLLMTCGAVQSNHCRATALVAARLGLGCVLFLRSPDGASPGRPVGNHLLARLAGAEVRFVDQEWWNDRNDYMAAAAHDLQAKGRSPWVIPEGASDALGMWGYVQAAAEAADQLKASGVERPIHWHASSSGGTTAGLAAYVSRSGDPAEVVAISVSDPVAGLARRIETIWESAFASTGPRRGIGDIELRDDYIGRGYGLATAQELAVQKEATSLTGLIFDPAYTGKALFALRSEIANGRFSRDDNVVLWHTGGGFAALAFDYGDLFD